MVLLGFLTWIVVGVVVGFIAGKLVDLHGDDPRLGIGIAAAGAAASHAMRSRYVSRDRYVPRSSYRAARPQLR